MIIKDAKPQPARVLIFGRTFSGFFLLRVVSCFSILIRDYHGISYQEDLSLIGWLVQDYIKILEMIISLGV